jgi:hypothetical protein
MVAAFAPGIGASISSAQISAAMHRLIRRTLVLLMISPPW